MHITSFDDLLAAARRQDQPQRLLFVFVRAELADDSSEEERRRFEAGEGGALVPVMAVDKSPDELGDFAALVRESLQFGQPWVLVFVAALSGRDGAPPAPEDTDRALARMTEAVRTGMLSAFISFDRDGQPVRFG